MFYCKMEAINKNSIGFVKISTLVVGICNVYFIGAEYQVEEKLDLAYFIIVLLLFSSSLLWTLAIMLIGVKPDTCLPAEAGLNAVASLLYLSGVICFVVSITKEDTSDDFHGGKVVSSLLGFLSTLLYASCRVLIFIHLKTKSDNKDSHA